MRKARKSSTPRKLMAISRSDFISGDEGDDDDEEKLEDEVCGDRI